MLWQSRAKRTYATMPEHTGSLPPGRSSHSHDDTTASTSGGTGNNYILDWTTEAHHAGKARTACTKISSKHARLYKKDTPSRGSGGTPTETGRQAHSLGISEQEMDKRILYLHRPKPYNRTTWTQMGQNGNIATVESHP